MADPYFQFTKLLERSQWYEPAKLKALQDKGLTRLLTHAWQQAPAYRERLAPLFEKGDVPDLSRWQEIPILTRKEAQANSLEYYARQVPEQAGETFEQQTSGSTGRPFKHRTSALQKVANQATIARVYNWYGVDPEKSCANFSTTVPGSSNLPDGVAKNEWQRGFPKGVGYWLDHKLTNSAQKLEWLLRHPTVYLGTTPNTALGIVYEAEHADVRLPRYEALMLGSEMLTDDTAKIIRAELSDTIINLYGSEETGRMTASCPHSNQMHIHEEICLLEVLDDQNREVEPGQTGRVVVTPFYNFAMPLIRYAVGDYAKRSPTPCKCARSSRTLSRIVGRERNLFRFMDGTSFWPSLNIDNFRSIVPFQQWQITQDRLDHVVVRLVTAQIGAAGDNNAFQAAMRQALHPSLSVDVEYVLDIPRAEGGKFEEFQSLL